MGCAVANWEQIILIEIGKFIRMKRFLVMQYECVRLKDIFEDVHGLWKIIKVKFVYLGWSVVYFTFGK